MGSQIKLRDMILNKERGLSMPLSQEYYSRIINLLMNAFKIECLDNDVDFGYCEETFVKASLIESGCVGYDKTTKRFYYAYGVSRNHLGYPKNLRLVTPLGKVISKEACYDKDENGAYILYAMPYPYSVSAHIKTVSDVLGECDASALQNIMATKTPAIYVCSSEDIRLSVEQAIQQQQQGNPVLVVNNELADAIKGVETKTEYIADRVELYKLQRIDEILNELGVLTSVDKAERVQSAEVNASIGECKDYISIWIDTFNRQTEAYDLPFTMKINNALEEIYPAVEDMDKGIDDIELENKEVNNND